MLHPRGNTALLACILVFISLSLVFLRFSSSPLSSYPSTVYHAYSQKATSQPVPSPGLLEDFADIANETLGFEKVFVVGLKERSDKRDALALSSALTGFKLEWVDGVRGETIPNKAVPAGVDRKALWETNLGSWRGHMNAVRGVVEQGLSSALIMEDDMDWDTRLKAQLTDFATGSRWLQHASANVSSPYGDDWDLLWLGHCGEVFPETLDEHSSKDPTGPEILELSRKYSIEHDVTVPPPEFTRGFPDWTEHPYTRWVHRSGGPICTFAYALSQSGARKVLFDLSVDHLSGPFDNALAGLCRWGSEPSRLGMKCISSNPGLFTHHKAKGSIAGDSDIQKVGDGTSKDEVREKGFTENVVWSTRNNLGNILTGKQMEGAYD